MNGVLKVILFLLIVTVLVLSAPFISFGKSVEKVCVDVARYFGIAEDEYEINFVRRVLNAAGDPVSGTHETDRETGKHMINIQKSSSRPMTIATIFHEFAHAAQTKYNLLTVTKDENGNVVERYFIDANGKRYSDEQHAELLAFDVMWGSGYWWNSMHMLLVHSFRAKPDKYLVPKQLWNTALTGAGPVSKSWRSV